LEKAEEILRKFDTGSIFEIKESKITPVEWCFKWTGDEYLFFAALSKVAEGYVAFRGEDNSLWKIELKDGKVIDYTGEIVYEETGAVSLPEDVLRDGVVVNERYLAAILGNSKMVVYDLKERMWLEKRFYGSLRDLNLIEDIIQARNHYAVSAAGNSNPDPETLKEFARKILDNHLDLEQKVKLMLLNELI
jgi:hypothetical protein